WETDVFPHKTGHVIEESLDRIEAIPKSYLPTPPASKLRWHQKVTAVNRSLVEQKPWSGGLLDSVIAVDLIAKSTLSQRNRIALIVLDSTVEIAYKEYLVNEAGIGAQKFRGIAENRADVQKEVAKHLKLSTQLIQKIDHYYKLRCDLIHQRAT